MTFLNKKAENFKLRITIEKAFNLAVADNNGLSDPYATLLLDGKKYEKTEVVTKTLNPVWNLLCNISLQKPFSLIEIYVWDKDRLRDARFKDLVSFKKEAFQDDFLGKIAIPVGQLFKLVHPAGKPIEYDSPHNKEVVLTLEKRTMDDNVSGEIQIRFGIVKLNENTGKDYINFWNDFIH